MAEHYPQSTESVWKFCAPCGTHHEFRVSCGHVVRCEALDKEKPKPQPKIESGNLFGGDAA